MQLRAPIKDLNSQFGYSSIVLKVFNRRWVLKEHVYYEN